MRKLDYYLIPFLLIGILLSLIYVSTAQKNQKETQSSLDKMQVEIEQYEKLLADTEKNNLMMEKTSFGFEKKGGQYLLDSAEDIYKLAELVNNGQDIEDGILAGEASYRFLNDITLPHKMKSDFLGIGTQEHSFHGIIDGDGHTLYGNFFADYEDESEYLIADGDGVIVNLYICNLFKQQFKSFSYNGMENGGIDLFNKLLNSPFTVDMSSNPWNLYVMISDQVECDRLVEFLNNDYQIGHLYLTIVGSSIDTTVLSNCIYKREGFYTQVYFQKEEQESDMSISTEGFLSHIDPMEIPKELRSMMMEEQLLSFRKQTVYGLNCYSYLFDGWSKGEEDSLPIFILAEGAWAGKENIRQLVTVPTSVSLKHSMYSIKAADVNFDGMQDLLIQIGTSSGTGGTWINYRSIIWEPETEEFVSFSSMPEQITVFDQMGKRIIQASNSGAGEETIIVYEVIDGEYRQTKRLDLVTWNEPAVLYYYEYGELVEEIIIHDDYEVIERFPDMNFWRKG